MIWIRKILARVAVMSRPAHLVLKYSLIVSGIYLAAAVIVLLGAGKFAPDTYHTYAMADYLLTTPQAILIVAVIGSACIEDAVT